MTFFENLLITLRQCFSSGRTRTLGHPIEPIIIEKDVAAQMAFASGSRRSCGDDEFGLSDLPPAQAFPLPAAWEFVNFGTNLSAPGDPLVDPDPNHRPGSRSPRAHAGRRPVP
jgi:hypothetical protein